MRTLVSAFLLFAAMVSSLAAADFSRFQKVKEFEGTFTSHAGSSGRRTDPYSTITYDSTIYVQAHFRISAYRDPKGGDRLSWRGKGEAAVRVVGTRVRKSIGEVETQKYDGDYVDTIHVTLDSIDWEKGTFQLMVHVDMWQEQPHRGKAIARHTTRVTQYGTYYSDDMTPGHGWANDAGAGFGHPYRFPEKGLALGGTLTSNNDDFMSQDGSHWVTNWKIRPVGAQYEEPLKAIAGGPYIVERGNTLNLDGLLSTGAIKSYHWSFAPVNSKSEIPFNAGATKEGRRVPLVALERVRATLTISDGKKESKDTVIIQVVERDYHTPFVHRTKEKIHPNSMRPRFIKGHDTEFVGGENVCALDEYSAKDSVHRLHPGSASGSWEDRGYTLKKVQDAGGPYDGVWYLASYSMRSEREVLMNKYILPGGPPPVSTTTPVYETNKNMGFDMDAYLAAARRHELLHSELTEESLKKNDPGPKIEGLGMRDKEALKKKVDAEIQKAEDTVDRDSADPLAKKFFHGTIAFPDDATDKYIPFEMTI